MKKLTATNAKDRFGELLNTAQREPVTIEKKGQPVAVVLSLEEYQRLEVIENAWWEAQAQKARKKGGWAGPQKSEKFLKDLMDAKG